MANLPDLDKYYQPSKTANPPKKTGFLRNIGKNSERLLSKTSNRMLLIKQAIFLTIVSFGIFVSASMFYEAFSALTDETDTFTLFLESTLYYIAVTLGAYIAFAGLIGIFATAGKINRGENASFTDIFTFAKKKYILRNIAVLALLGGVVVLCSECYYNVCEGYETLRGLAVRFYGERAYYGVAVCLIPVLLIFVLLGFLIVSLSITVLPTLAQSADRKGIEVITLYFRLLRRHFSKMVLFGAVSAGMAVISMLPVGVLFLLFFLPRFALDSTKFVETFTEEIR